MTELKNQIIQDRIVHHSKKRNLNKKLIHQESHLLLPVEYETFVLSNVHAWSLIEWLGRFTQ